MKNNILVSAIVPAFNHEKYVSEALKSILSQNYDNIELLVINDGSSDSTHQKILELKNECVSKCANFIYFSKENKGVAHTLNLGIRLAKGKYTFLMASDDLAEPKAISTLLNILEKSDQAYAVACGDSDFIDSYGNKIYLDSKGNFEKVSQKDSFSSFVAFQTRFRFDFNYRTSSFGSYASLLPGNYIPGGLLIKREALLDVGLYDERCTLEDWKMWLKLSKRYKMKFFDNILCHYRLHDSNTFRVKKKLLVKEGIKLLIHEKKYCFSRGMTTLWKRNVADSILSNIQWLSKADIREFLKHISLLEFFLLSAINLVKKRAIRLNRVHRIL